MSRFQPLLSAPEHLPRPGDAERAAEALAAWRREAAETAWGAELAALAADPAGDALLRAIFGTSPFLTQCVHADPGALARAAIEGPSPVLADACDRARAAAEAAGQDTAMAELRRARRTAALTVALADLGGVWPLEEVTAGLSAFADAAVQGALGFLLRRAVQRGQLDAGGGAIDDACGLCVLAVGKLGARELNYSSDIDLVAVHDPDAMPYTGSRDPDRFAVKTVRELTRMLEEPTGDGHVARVDLRLRPDPSAMPLSVSVGAWETYYESLGQNWERAAMIKARPCAGDPGLGRTLQRLLKPFVWRTHLDFWAIRDVHAMKRQIHAKRGGSTVAVAGHDVKLGRGGIREIEFYVQTQQLIWGGRHRELRQPRTLDALDALARARLISRRDADVLADAYRLLRRVEHRLQMIADQQTQRVPEDDAGVARIAAFMGDGEPDAFRETLLGRLRTVEDRYAALFEEAPSLSGPGNLVFTGGEPDPETVRTLQRMGFADGERVITIVAGWHRGRYRATRSPRAREILTELIPTLLEALGRTAEPDGALAKVDEFLSGLPAGVQLFAMLHANPRLLDLLARIMGAAPNLAAHLSHRPGLLDAVLAPSFFDALPGREALAADVARTLAEARDYQDALDLVRRWANDRKFQVGVHLLEGLADVDDGGAALAAVAESAIDALWPWVRGEFAQQHGELAGEDFGVVAMGKLGAREMLTASDLDLVFAAETTQDADEPSTGGRRPLDPGRYFARLAQRLINALSAPTAEGRLYEVDMRLRPHGDSGPLVAGPDALRRYYAEDAWTWEFMALTRARPILGSAALTERLRAIVREALTRPRDPAALMGEVDAMRQRLAREFPARDSWDVKYRRGGLVDLEFLSQALQLRHAHDHPDILDPGTETPFQRMAARDLISREIADTLSASGRLMRHVQGMIRLMAGGQFDPATAPQGLMDRLAATCGEPDAEALRTRLDATAERVFAHYREFILTHVPDSGTAAG